MGLLRLASAVAAPRVESLTSSTRQSAAAATAIPELVGGSAAMADVRRAVTRAAGAPFSVLIEGESGVGKEVVARLIHERSHRSRMPLVTINCASVPDSLLASELFGHARGSFTDAHRDRAGWLEQANRGTVFLDEIGDLPLALQVKLLKVIEESRFIPVGGLELKEVDVRIITATHHDLRQMVADLVGATNLANQAIRELKQTAVEADLTLNTRLEEAERFGIEEIIDPRDTRLLLCDWAERAHELVRHELTAGPKARGLRP